MNAPLPPSTSPCLFLSHSGADTEAARELRKRILESPTAREAGLKVWFDKDDLKAGREWQAQLEHALENEATAFAVYVGSRGVINWVEREVRAGLSRATGENAIPFIPIISAQAEGVGALPPFARQFQGVKDPLANEEDLARLIAAALGGESTEDPILTDAPFVGLRPMTEQESDRFFGRAAEIGEVLEKLRRQRLVAIVAESGSGKSSLAQAGVIPAFRGGALEDTSQEEPDNRTRHVVVMRPGNDPARQLREAVTDAAERLGLGGEACAGLRMRIDLNNPEETAYAIRCDLPVRSTETLLIVDQFEELLRLPAEDGVAFVRLLLALSAEDAPNGFRILLTLRADYFNLASAHVDLYAALTANDNEAVYRLKRISDDGLEEAVRKPLAMAGHRDEREQKTLLNQFRRDIMDRPGDLALVQMALFALWRHRSDYDKDLVKAYVGVGGISGALAHEAEHVRTDKLTREEQECLLATFVRLIRLGDTGGVTRRVASLNEFDETRRSLAEKLASEGYSRLLMAAEETIEVAHEALMTQWPWLHENIGRKSTADDIRRLERLMDRAGNRSGATEEDKSKYLAVGADLEEFKGINERHPDWLSEMEADLVDDFIDAERRRIEAAQREKKDKEKAQRDKLMSAEALAAANNQTARRTIVGLFAALLLAAIAGWQWLSATNETQRAEAALVKTDAALKAADTATAAAIEERDEARITQSRFLSDLAQQQAKTGDGTSARLLALAGLKDADGDTEEARERPYVGEAEPALYAGHFANRELDVLAGHESWVTSAVFSPDGARLATASDDNTARIWDVENGSEITVMKGHENWVQSAIFSTDGTRLVTASWDDTARIWDVENGSEIAVLKGHESTVTSAVFSPDGTRLATASSDNTARIWDVENGSEIAVMKGHENRVWSAVFSPDGTRLATASDDNTARIWRVFPSTQMLAEYSKQTAPRCLTERQLAQFYLPRQPPRWCITGPGLQQETDPEKWQPKWPYLGPAWREWLMAGDRGEDPPFPKNE